jgi:hypothetical protein
MRHARLLLKLATGFLWAVGVALWGFVMVLNEEYSDAFEAWQK